MSGVFINLTENVLRIRTDGEPLEIQCNPDLITPIRQSISTTTTITPIYGNSFITVPMIREHIKYPFTQDQIDTINQLSQGKTRLFILNSKDVEYWSIGRFQCPFRNYRLFTPEDANSEIINLIEYPIPKTYLDIVVGSFGDVVNVTKKLYNKSPFA